MCNNIKAPNGARWVRGWFFVALMGENFVPVSEGNILILTEDTKEKLSTQNIASQLKR